MDADPVLGGHEPAVPDSDVESAHKTATPNQACRKRIRLASVLDAQSSRSSLFSISTNAPTFGLLSAGGHPLLGWLLPDVANLLCVR
jgi:hypothetical protein